MGLLLSLIAGLVIWIIGWAVGVKSFDAFLVTILIVLLAAMWRLLKPSLPGADEADLD
jgi:hypothetical protein